MNTLTLTRKETEMNHEDINDRFDNFKTTLEENDFDLTFDEMNDLLDAIVEDL